MTEPSTKPRILIAEDEMIIAEDLREILENLDYMVVGIAISAREAMALTEEKSPDLLLLDIRLKGGRDGIEQYDNLSRINMEEYMKQLSDFLAQTYRTNKQIEVIIEADDVNLDIDTAVPLGLITNELLSNAWKYAFNELEKGEIRITLKTKGSNKYELMISDTGIGLPEHGIEKKGSLGLRLVRSLTRQLQGQLQIETAPGTSFLIEFEEMNVAA